MVYYKYCTYCTCTVHTGDLSSTLQLFHDLHISYNLNCNCNLFILFDAITYFLSFSIYFISRGSLLNSTSSSLCPAWTGWNKLLTYFTWKKLLQVRLVKSLPDRKIRYVQIVTVLWRWLTQESLENIITIDQLKKKIGIVNVTCKKF